MLSHSTIMPYVNPDVYQLHRKRSSCRNQWRTSGSFFFYRKSNRCATTTERKPITVRASDSRLAPRGFHFISSDHEERGCCRSKSRRCRTIKVRWSVILLRGSLGRIAGPFVSGGKAYGQLRTTQEQNLDEINKVRLYCWRCWHEQASVIANIVSPTSRAVRKLIQMSERKTVSSFELAVRVLWYSIY